MGLDGIGWAPTEGMGLDGRGRTRRGPALLTRKGWKRMVVTDRGEPAAEGTVKEREGEPRLTSQGLGTARKGAEWRGVTRHPWKVTERSVAAGHGTAGMDWTGKERPAEDGRG